MEGAMMLLLFSAFLVIVIYRMDQNEKKANRHDDDAYKSGFEDGMRWMTDRARGIESSSKSILRRRK